MSSMKLRHSLRLFALWLLSHYCRSSVPTVLMYHSVSRSNQLYFTVTPEEFHRQLSYLQMKGHQIISMNEIASFFGEKAETLSKKSVCLTFDDGYRDNLTEALPILEQFQAPAIIYVATNYALKGESPKHLPVCSPQEIRELAAHPLITVGAHTHTHPKLSKLPKDAARQDILQGLRMLEEWIQQPIHHFAYPHGSFSVETIELVKEIGFQTAVTTRPEYIGYHQDEFRIGRIAVDQGMPFWLFTSSCTKSIPLYSSLKNRVLFEK